MKGHSKEHPGFWLHTGGTGILTYFDSKDDKLGEWEEKEFNDYSGVSSRGCLGSSGPLDLGDAHSGIYG